jgi:hypothetical protein
LSAPAANDSVDYDRFADLPDTKTGLPAKKRRCAAPGRGHEIVAADHALPRASEEFQEVEDLRLDRDEVIAAAQLAAAGIEDEVVE